MVIVMVVIVDQTVNIVLIAAMWQGEEMERLREILHEQGREIDQLRQENNLQEQRILKLETALEEEMERRKGDLESMTVKIETEVQERIFYDRRITTVVNDDRDANNNALSCLREDFMRENEILR